MYHLGIGEIVAVSTLSKSNETHPYLIYQDLAMLLINEARQLYINDTDLKVELKENVFVLDATTID